MRQKTNIRLFFTVLIIWKKSRLIWLYIIFIFFWIEHVKVLLKDSIMMQKIDSIFG